MIHPITSSLEVFFNSDSAKFVPWNNAITRSQTDDIFTVCDRVMALFQGTNFAESELKNTSRDEVIGWIMGKKD